MQFLDWLFPRHCEICHLPVDRPARHLCTDCLNRLPLLPTDGLCRCCGRDAVGLNGEFLCEDCRNAKTRPHYDRAVSAMRFEDEARQLVNSFKFRTCFHLRNDFVDLLEGAVRTRFKIDEIDLLAPMPSTFIHRFLRGYNQCEYLARPLSRRLNIEYAPHFIRRIGDPKRQGTLNEDQRRENVVDTFAPGRQFRPVDTVLVIDDIMTTGSTLSECARTLKAAGIRRVFTATLARSLR